MSRLLRGAWLPLLGLTTLACAQAPSRELSADFTVSRRLAVDPATSLGEFFLSNSDDEFTRQTIDSLDRSLDTISCEGEYSLVFRVEGELDDRGGEGRVALLFVRAFEGSICEGGAGLFDPLSLRDRRDRTSYLIEGPAFFEGRRMDARLPMGNVPLPAFSESFPPWWNFSGRLQGFETVPSGDGEPTPQFTDVGFSAPWTIHQLSRATPPMPTVEGGTFLDAIATFGLQPDIDRDGDGLETFEATSASGRLTRCIDGDGTAFEGPDCATLPEFADAYELRLRFRVRPIRVVD